MDNKAYMMSMLFKSEEIIIDTSTLMDPGITGFVENCKTLLPVQGKKVTVPEYVLAELTSHISKSNMDKREKAMRALAIINDNPDVFDSAAFTTEELWNEFADAEILSQLTTGRMDRSQLLITSDKKLSSDAYNLNYLESCKGYPIKVCYVNSLGELHRCECVGKKLEVLASDSLTNETRDIKTDTLNEMTDCVGYLEKEDHNEGDIKSLILGVGAFGFGIVASKYWRPAMKLTKSLLDVMCA